MIFCRKGTQKKKQGTTKKRTKLFYFLNLKTAVGSGRLAEAVGASALVGFVLRTNRCAFTNPPSASATTSSRNTSPPTAVFRLKTF
jgi:hypothetical protein